MIAVKCNNVAKTFGKTKALEQVSFELEQGKIYALLGKNGAGKTTLLNCLCTKYLPDSGEIYLLEEEAYENQKVLSQICFMSDYMETFSMKRVTGILKFASQFYEKWDDVLMERLLDFFEINKKSLYKALSKGKKTAVSIIIGLCSGCEIVLLDEIYSGLDAAVRKSFYEILMEQQEKTPRTFLLSTHLIEEMSGLFDHVLMMEQGKIILNDNIEDIHNKSYKCIGRTDQADSLKNKNVLSKKTMGAVTEYCIYDDLSVTEREQLEGQGLTFQTLSLQELFIAVTSGSTKEWGE